MSKRFLVFAVACLSLVVGASSATDLVRHLAGSEEIAYLDVGKLWSSPVLAAQRGNIEAFFEQSEVKDFTPDDISWVLAGVREDNQAAVFLKFKSAERLEALIKANFSGLKPTGQNGMQIYQEDKVAFAVVAPDLVLFSDDPARLEAVWKTDDARFAARISAMLPSGNHAMWAVLLKIPQDSGISVERVVATFGFIGQADEDQIINVALVCPTKEAASQNAMVVPGMIQMLAGLFFNDAPELGAELCNGIKSAVSDCTVTFSLTISKVLASKLADYVKQKSELNPAEAAVPAQTPVPVQTPAPGGAPVQTR